MNGDNEVIIRLERERDEAQRDLTAARAEIERLNNRDHDAMSEAGHDGSKCGSLCPYCEIARLKELVDGMAAQMRELCDQNDRLRAEATDPNDGPHMAKTGKGDKS